MAYLPLHNFKYDSGPRRIQSGPDHEGYVVVSSGVRSLGADNGIIVAGTPISGVYGSGQQWGYDANWRYVPPAQYTDTFSTQYNTSLILGASTNTTLTSPITIAGAKTFTTIVGSLTSKPDVYYGGKNLPGANGNTEGSPGGGVILDVYENPSLINIFGNQGTANRSEWNYSQPVYCKTFTETIRSTQPGLMSSFVQSVYRGISTTYNENYGSNVFGRSFEFPINDIEIDVGYQPEVDTGLGEDKPTPFDTLTVTNPLPDSTVTWYGCNNVLVGTGLTYQPTIADAGCNIYPVVTQDGVSFTGPSVTIYRPSVIYTNTCRNVKVVFQGSWSGYQLGYDKFPFPSSCSDPPNVQNYFVNPGQVINNCLNFCSMQFALAEPLNLSTFPEAGPITVGKYNSSTKEYEPYLCGRTEPCGIFFRGVSGYYKWWSSTGPEYNVSTGNYFFGTGGGIGGVWGGSCPVAYYSVFYTYDQVFVGLLDYVTSEPLEYGVDYFVAAGYTYLPTENPPVWDGSLP